MSKSNYAGDTFHERDIEVAGDVATLKAQIVILTAEVDKLKKDSESIKAMANRWKGGGAALIAFGTIVGSLIASWDKVKALFVKLG